MGKIFVSYRRIESADFTGRLFDRLSGFFGNDRVYMDVDDLIAGKDYREQIGEIIGQCDVLLAVIGEQWIDICDHNGQRRLLIEDDQLRIEIESALELGKAVIPILIHGAKQPTADQVPATLAAIATLPTIEIQSGLPFNADVKKLLDVLQLRHGLSHPDKRFPLEMILIPLGILLIVTGVCNFSAFPALLSYIQAEIQALQPEDALFLSRNSELPPYREAFWGAIGWCVIPLFFGPLLIVAGKRWCCLTKDATARRMHFSRGVGRTAPPKNAKSIYCFAAGITSFSLGALSILPAFLFGIWAFYETYRRHSWIRGRSLAVVGMLLSLGGIFITWAVHLPMLDNYSWYTQLEDAKVFLKNKEYDQAIQVLEAMSLQYAERDDLTSFTDLARANTLLQMGDIDRGMQALGELVESEFDLDDQWGDTPSLVLREAHETRARIFDSQGNFAAARQERAAKNEVGQRLPNENDTYFYPGGYGGEPPPTEESDPLPPAPLPPAPLPPAPIVDPSAANTTTEDAPAQPEPAAGPEARVSSSTTIPNPFESLPTSTPAESTSSPTK